MSLSETLEPNFQSIFKEDLKTKRLILWLLCGSWRRSHARLCWYSISACKKASHRFSHDIFGLESNEVNCHSPPPSYFHLDHKNFMRKCGKFLLKFRYTRSTKLGIRQKQKQTHKRGAGMTRLSTRVLVWSFLKSSLPNLYILL